MANMQIRVIPDHVSLLDVHEFVADFGRLGSEAPTSDPVSITFSKAFDDAGEFEREREALAVFAPRGRPTG
jgi:hypothetical protein